MTIFFININDIHKDTKSHDFMLKNKLVLYNFNIRTRQKKGSGYF